MVSFSLIATFALAGLACAASAPKNSDSPPNSAYMAVLSNDNITTVFEFTETKGVVSLTFSGFNNLLYGGPFDYIIHERRIPLNGTCWDTKGIFNPYNGSYPTGNDSIPDSDVAIGKLVTGAIDSPGLGWSFPISLPYLSLNPNNTAFIGNLSVVFQHANKTPIACGNIWPVPVKHYQSGASKLTGAMAALPLAAGAAALFL